MPSNHLILCHALLLLPSIFASISSYTACQPFASGGQIIGASVSSSVLPMNIQCWFPLRLTDLISFLSKGHWRVFSSTIIRKHQFFSAHLSLWSNTDTYTWPGKTIALTIGTIVGKVMSLLFTMVCLYVGHSFSSKKQASFNFTVAVTICSDFGAQENKVWHCFHCFPSICYEFMGPDAMIFDFESWILSQIFHSSFTFIKRFFSAS